MKRKNTPLLPVEYRPRIEAMMEKFGVCQAAKFLGISRHAMERAAGGLTIQKGTVAYLVHQIAVRDAEGKQP